MSYFFNNTIVEWKELRNKRNRAKNLSILFYILSVLSVWVRLLGGGYVQKIGHWRKKSPHFSSMTNFSYIYQIQLTSIYIIVFWFVNRGWSGILNR